LTDVEFCTDRTTSGARRFVPGPTQFTYFAGKMPTSSDDDGVCSAIRRVLQHLPPTIQPFWLDLEMIHTILKRGGYPILPFDAVVNAMKGGRSSGVPALDRFHQNGAHSRTYYKFSSIFEGYKCYKDQWDAGVMRARLLSHLLKEHTCVEDSCAAECTSLANENKSKQTSKQLVCVLFCYSPSVSRWMDTLWQTPVWNCYPRDSTLQLLVLCCIITHTHSLSLFRSKRATWSPCAVPPLEIKCGRLVESDWCESWPPFESERVPHPTVKLVFESPTDVKRKSQASAKRAKDLANAKAAAQKKKDQLLRELEKDEKRLKKGKFHGLFQRVNKKVGNVRASDKTQLRYKRILNIILWLARVCVNGALRAVAIPFSPASLVRRLSHGGNNNCLQKT